MGLGHLERLRRIRLLLVAQKRPGAEHARLACYSGAGFTPELHAVAEESTDVVLADLAWLYS
jgi:hypothetical protein